MSTCNDLSVYRTLRACQNPCCNLTLHEQTGEYFPNNPRTYEPVLRFRIDEDAAGQRTLHRKQMQICAKKIYTKGSKKAGVFCRVTLYVLLCTFRPSLALPLSLSFSLPLSLFLSLSLSFSLSLSVRAYAIPAMCVYTRAQSTHTHTHTHTGDAKGRGGLQAAGRVCAQGKQQAGTFFFSFFLFFCLFSLICSLSLYSFL